MTGRRRNGKVVPLPPTGITAEAVLAVLDMLLDEIERIKAERDQAREVAVEYCEAYRHLLALWPGPRAAPPPPLPPKGKR